MYDRARDRGRRRTASQEIWPPPRKGWQASGRLANADREAAEILDNFFPTAEGARIRGGKLLHASLTGDVKMLIPYASGGTGELFAADGTTIYDVTAPANPAVVSGAKLTGYTDGYWSYTQYATTGGDYLWLVNGSDPGVLYDGTKWTPVTGAAVTALPYTGASGVFVLGETVTGGTSGASATIVGWSSTSATAGTLYVGTVTSGPFQNGETLTSDGETATCGTPAAHSSLAITGVDTAALSFVWPHKGRLWFVERDTLSLWYTAAGSVAGAVSEFPINGIPQYGGSVLFGQTLSSDSGDGMDDRLVVVTTEGEMLIYAGTDPSDAATWSLEGTYRIGRPLSKNAWARAGGDLLIATEDGLVSALSAISRDRATLIAEAVTAPIEDAWQKVVAQRSAAFPFIPTLWQSQTLLLLGVPPVGGLKQAFVVNTRTGAWARYTGWCVRTSAVHNDRLYFGSSDGSVWRGEVTGLDGEDAYAALWVPKFRENRSGDYMQANAARIVVKSGSDVLFRLSALADYRIPALPNPETSASDDPNVWGTGTWGTSLWGGARDVRSQSSWQSVFAGGYALSCAVQIGVGQTATPDIRLASLHLLVERGGAL